MSAYAMPRVGDVLAGKYRLEKVAGEGGMGIVYAAEHLVLRQRVAVKVLLPDAAASEAVVERFAREAQAGARIQSEHVARVMDAGSTEGGAPFLVMEYLEGCDLEELLELQGTLPVVEVVDSMLQALEALAHAHAVGLVHRDLKPANLFLACRQDGGNVIKMLDFGISKSMKATREEKVLTGQAVLGSPVYMSPEQLRNAKEIDGRADLWSLGVVAYELLCGKPPFDGDGVGEIFAAILEKDAEPLHVRDPRVPASISAIIARCLQRKPEDRWADAAELARALGPLGSGAWNGVIERAEQVLARSKRLSVADTPTSTRLVVDAIAAAAARARTTGGGGRSAGATLAALEAIGHEARTATRRDGGTTRARGAVRRMSPARWVAVAAAAFVVVGMVVGARAAVRAGRPATPRIAPPQAVAAAGPESQGPAQTTTTEEPEDAPMVMDLPDTPGHTAVSPRSSSKAKPGKPQRPKFLNTRE